MCSCPAQWRRRSWPGMDILWQPSKIYIQPAAATILINLCFIICFCFGLLRSQISHMYMRALLNRIVCICGAISESKENTLIPFPKWDLPVGCSICKTSSLFVPVQHLLTLRTLFECPISNGSLHILPVSLSLDTPISHPHCPLHLPNTWHNTLYVLTLWAPWSQCLCTSFGSNIHWASTTSDRISTAVYVMVDWIMI